MISRYFSGMLVTGLVLSFCGCASTVTSNTARTAKEQMLLSNAVDKSLDKVSFSPLYDLNVFLDDKYLDCVDKQYVMGSVRHRALRSGARLVDKAEDADIVMELRSGGVGTDTTDSFLGIPEITLPGMLTVPEVRLLERKSQYGYAKLGLVLYDAKTKSILGDGGVSLAQSDDNNTFVMGIGPFRNGSLKSDVGRAQSAVPGMSRRALPSTVAFAALAPPATAADVPSFQFASESETKP